MRQPMTDKEQERLVARFVSSLDQLAAALDDGVELAADSCRLMLLMIARDGSAAMLARTARAIRDSFTEPSDREKIVHDALADGTLCEAENA